LPASKQAIITEKSGFLMESSNIDVYSFRCFLIVYFQEQLLKNLPIGPVQIAINLGLGHIRPEDQQKVSTTDKRAKAMATPE